jgi:hypothetical protein
MCAACLPGRLWPDESTPSHRRGVGSNSAPGGAHAGARYAARCPTTSPPPELTGRTHLHAPAAGGVGAGHARGVMVSAGSLVRRGVLHNRRTTPAGVWYRCGGQVQAENPVLAPPRPASAPNGPQYSRRQRPCVCRPARATGPAPSFPHDKVALCRPPRAPRHSPKPELVRLEQGAVRFRVGRRATASFHPPFPPGGLFCRHGGLCAASAMLG